MMNNQSPISADVGAFFLVNSIRSKTHTGADVVGTPFDGQAARGCGVPVLSWEYETTAFAIFARDMDLAINNPVWGLFDAPWKKKAA